MLIFACSAVVALAACYVLAPLFKEPKGNLEVELLAETELDRLLNRKAIVYSNLKDLEFEYKMGRLSDADFRQLEAGLKGEASVLLQHLDQLGVENNIDEILEKDIVSRKEKLRAPGTGANQPRAGRCTRCGADLVPGKKFCADCGQRL
jgi:hypothetical protein